MILFSWALIEFVFFIQKIYLNISIEFEFLVQEIDQKEHLNMKELPGLLIDYANSLILNFI